MPVEASDKNRDLADGYTVEHFSVSIPADDSDVRRRLSRAIQEILQLPPYLTRLNLSIEANKPTSQQRLKANF